MLKYVANRLKRILVLLDDESDYFRPFDCALVIGGIHLSSNNVLLRFLFVLYRILIVLFTILLFNRIYVAIFEWNSLADTLGAICMTTASILIIYRLVATRYCFPNLQQVRCYLSRGLNNRSHETRARNRSYRIVRGISLWALACLLIDQVLHQIFNLSNTLVHGTPDNLIRFGPNWEKFFDALNTCLNPTLSLLYVVNLTVHNSYLMGTHRALRDLVSDYDALFSRVDEKVELEANQISTKLYDLEKRKLFWNILKDELNATVIRHNELLEQLENLKRFLNMTFPFMFYTHFQALACGLLYCIDQGLSVDSAILTSYVLVNLAELFWLFKLVNDLNEANEKICFTVYNLDWHQRLKFVPALESDYKIVRTALLVIMMKSRTKLKITCGGLFEISVEAFGDLVIKMYNVLAFLLKITN